MKLNRVLCIVLLLSLFTILSTPIYSHSSSQQGILEKPSSAGTHKYFGSEDVGWIINEEAHTNFGTTILFRFEAGTDSDLKTIVRQGATKWNSALSQNNSNNIISENSGINTNIYFRPYDQDVWGVTFIFGTNSSGHITSWQIHYNSYHVDDPTYPITSVTAAHEFGHVIGLLDLYESTNCSKLMFGYEPSRTATSPSYRDKCGAKVILGIHQSHSWSVRFKGTNGNGQHMHEYYCTVCKGVKYNSAALCVYNSNNVCRVCGTPSGQSPQSIELPRFTEILLPNTPRKRFFLHPLLDIEE